MRSLLALAFLCSVTAGAEAQSYAGEWRAGPLQVRNATTSWGSDCPPRLPAAQTESGGNVQVAQAGDHLTVSGAVRGNTRSCWGQNPALRRISSRYQNGTWTIVCRTPESDSRGESARYEFTASSSDRISYRETVEYDWQLNQSRCQVRRTATRIFERAGAATEPEPDMEPVAMNEPACTPGPARSVRISPSQTAVAPGERVCFSTRVVDAAGCTVPGAPLSLELSRPEGLSGTLRGRCFEAGNTAADSEGTYRVVATSASLSASARIVVSSEDLSDLVAQREQQGLSRTEGRAEGDESSGVAASTGEAVVPIVAVAVAAFLLVGGLLFFWIGRKKKAATAAGTTEEPAFSASPSGGVRPPVAASAAPAAVPEPREPSTCPKCGHQASNTKFCPNDGIELIDPSNPKVAARGKICPKCRTGHDASATRCRNDGTELVFYALYDAQQKFAASAEHACPKCGKSFATSVAFCPEDGTRLGT